MRSATFPVFLVCVLAWAGVAGADDYTGASGGNYNVGANWSGGSVPDGDDSAYIRNGATVTVNSSVSSPIELWVGGTTDPNGANGSALHILPGAVLTTTTGSFTVAQAYDASVYQSGGSIATPWFRMSEGGGGDSTYDLTGGSLIMDYRLRAGTPTWTMDIGRGGGTARFVQTGGYVSLINNYYLNVGYGVGSLGEFTMTNGSIYVSYQQFNVGASGGQGTFTMSGGAVESRYKTQVGYRGNGVFNQNGGSVIHGGLDEAMILGHCDEDASVTGPSQGVYNLNAGLLEVLGSRGPRIGSYANPTYGQGVGILNVSGNALLLADPVNRAGVVSVGYKNGKGTLNVSGGSVFTSAILVADSIQNSSWPLPAGVVNVSGGSIEATTEFTVGRHGYGELNITGGSVLAGSGNPSTSLRAGENNAGAEGVINVSGGTLTALKTVDLGYQLGKGTLNISGGLVDIGYNTNIARETPSSGTPGRAEVNISGGSFQGKVVYVGYRGSYSPGLDAELNITGGTFRATYLYMLYQCKPGVGNKATLKVGADADVAVSSLFNVYATGSSVEMEIASATKNSKITSAGSVFLGSGLATLAVNSTGYRPREGDKFTLLAAAPGYYMTGSFSSISSNITRGLPGSAAFTGAVVTDPNTSAYSYVVTFQGWTAGDANGDHKVDGSDLALMGGAWMKTGQTWGTCEFTGDAAGLVDGSDLALMGGNWMWVKPAPVPEGQTALPEPATLALLGLGGMALLRRRRGYGG